LNVPAPLTKQFTSAQQKCASADADEIRELYPEQAANIFMKKSIGIDLGTTNSVAAIKKVSAEVLKNKEGEYITPSCVTVKKRLMRKPEFIVGRNALEWIRQESENTITAVKRLIGRNFNDKEVQKLIEGHGLRYKLVTHSRGSENSLAILAGGTEFTPEDISAKILAKIKADAEEALRDEVDSAVITVPAYFNDKQKHGTRTAATLAGLKVRRLLPEPTAAAISFGVDNISGDDGRTVLVFDFGGGTLDLSILTISGGQIIEMGKGGDMWLGGEDIDQLVIDYVLRETAKKEGIDDSRALIDRQKTSQKNKFLAALKTAVEKAKIALSDSTETCIEILGVLLDEDGDALDVEVELSRSRFDALMAPMLESMLELVRGVIAGVHFTEDLIDNVLLVGGSSRIPCVINAIREEFGQERVMLHERPMLAVAEGAAILSHRLADTMECPQCGKETNQTDAVCPHCGYELASHTVEQGLVEIVHAAAHDYYIKLENDKRFLLVEKNTPLPCSSTEVFQLVNVEQELVHMKFYNVVNEQEQSIGDLWLGIDRDRKAEIEPEAKAEKNVEDMQAASTPPRIAITLDIDENNLVDVNAALLDQPDVAVSRTLSRGKADEKLFLALEHAVNDADKLEYSTYTVIDLQNRARSIINSINGVVDPKTDVVNEARYAHAQDKIHKAVKIAENEEAPLTLIYYAESMLNNYSVLIKPKTKERLREKIEKLRQVDEDGSYEVTMQASDALSDALDDDGLSLVNVLMQIENAGEICFTTDPAKAKKFMRVISDIFEAAERGDRSVADKVNDIMPEVDEVLENYAMNTRKIHRDIRK
jgi:molecular chaperone DnaK